MTALNLGLSEVHLHRTVSFRGVSSGMGGGTPGILIQQKPHNATQQVRYNLNGSFRLYA